MSKTSDALLLYEKSKTAMLLGLGYLAAKDPIRAVRIGLKVGQHYGGQLMRDAGFITRLAKEEIIDVEVARAKNFYSYQRAKLPPGSIVTAGAWIPLVAIGGYTVYAVELTEFDKKMRDFFGVILPNDEQEIVM
jgi:hypothetical protein